MQPEFISEQSQSNKHTKFIQKGCHYSIREDNIKFKICQTKIWTK